MSNRTIFEFNHDLAHRIAAEPRVFAELMDRYTRSGAREDAEDLERFGVRLLTIRHHSTPFTLTVSGETFTG